jgi:Tfp pilus assembly protein PilV
MHKVSLRRRRARSTQRGVVLFEALIAISLITILFASVVYFHNVYIAQTRALRVARTQAWLATERSCKGGGHGTAAEAATVPVPYAAGPGRTMGLSAKLDMMCTEKNDSHKDLAAVFVWAGIADQMSSFGGRILDAVF